MVKFSAKDAKAESKSPASLPAGACAAPEIIVVGGAGLKTGVELSVDEFPKGFKTSPKGSNPSVRLAICVHVLYLIGDDVDGVDLVCVFSFLFVNIIPDE